MSEIWIAHLSIDGWQVPSVWSGYFEQAQELLGSPLTHLDVNDPVKRKVASLVDAGNFVCAFKEQEDSRWLFGKWGGTGIGFSIQHYRQLRHWPNALTWHVPLSFVEKSENRQRLKALFDVGNQTFKPFYAYGDDVDQIAGKKKLSGAVDIQAELLGVFWLTYFNPVYVAFFGKDKFIDLPDVECGDDGGVTIILGDSPKSVTSEQREKAVAALGKQSFVNTSDILGKQPGRFALTFEQLLAKR
jgi:hypothetical protein